MYVCVCVTPPPWFISSDGALFLRAITVDWESAVWACNDCLHQFLTCTGLWRSLSNVPVVKAKQSHQISSTGSSYHGVRFSLCVFAEFTHRGDEQNAFSFSAPRSVVIQVVNSVWILWVESLQLFVPVLSVKMEVRESVSSGVCLSSCLAMHV